MKAAKACAFHEAQSPPQARHRPSICILPLLIPLLLSLSLFLRLVFFSGRCHICRDEGSCLLEHRQKRCRLVSLGHKTTSFWPFFIFLKPLPKRHRFGMCRELKKKTAAFQNDAVLYHKCPKRRRLGCRTLEIVFLGVPTLIFALFQAKINPNTPNNGIREERAENQPKQPRKLWKQGKISYFHWYLLPFSTFNFFFLHFLMILVHDLAYANE